MATSILRVRTDRKGFKKTRIFVQVCIDSKIKYFPTKEKISPDFWDFTNHRVKAAYGKGYQIINASINETKAQIDNIIRSAELDGIAATFELISEEWEMLQSPKQKLPSLSFLDWFQHFINQSQSEKANQTIKAYKTVFNHIEEYFTVKNTKPTFERINYDFYSSFTNWLIEYKELSNSTVNKTIKNLKVFLNYASRFGLYDVGKYKDFKRLIQHETTAIYITIDELKRIKEHDFSDNLRLDKVRDLFLLLCYTGLRESDLSSLRPENIKGDQLSIQVQKTAEPLVIPLLPDAKAILTKYDNQLPKYSQQKLNDYIKEVGKLSGIDEPTEKVKYLKAKRIKETLPKYELMSSHTGRRTFITQSILRDMTPSMIQKVTGHKNLSSFAKYIKLSRQDVADEMEKKWMD